MDEGGAAGGYEISADPSRIDVKAVHGYLARSYWAAGIPIEVVRRSIANSLCVGAFAEGRQVGFARLVTDRATFAYLCDVYVLEEHRGRGVARRLVDAVMAHRELQGLRRWMLITRDAHGLYERSGFARLERPERVMEIRRQDVYQQDSGGGDSPVTRA